MIFRTASFLATLLPAALISIADAPAPKADPLDGYFGNTLVCAAGVLGEDLCHTWLERDGTFINIDAGGIHRGHYLRGPTRTDGKVPVCYHYDSERLVLPPEAMAPPPGTAMPPRRAGSGGMICHTADFRTTCTRYDSEEGLGAEDKARLKWTIAQRFHDGICYPLAPKQPGDSWLEEDDPLPSQNGVDKLFLLRGHR